MCKICFRVLLYRVRRKGSDAIGRQQDNQPVFASFYITKANVESIGIREL